MTLPVFLAALFTAVAVYALVRSVLWTPMRLGPRVAPFSARVRQRLGTPVAVSTPGATSLWAPLVLAAARALGSVVDASTSGGLELRLRQAGMGHLGVDDFRRRQLGYTLAGAGIGLVLAMALRLSVLTSLMVIVVAAIGGLTRCRATIDRRIEQRRVQIQAEAHMICQLCAIYLRTGDTPQGAIERFTARSAGAMSDELAAAIGLIRSGSPAPAVFEQLASNAADPMAARFYRLYGATWHASGDPDALMALADVLRAGRREDLARRMTRRNVAMVLPLVLVIGPILILFIVAALPSIILGR